MKFLRNPWVTGGLCAIAVVLALYQIFPGRLRGTGTAPGPVVAPASQEAKTSRWVEATIHKSNEFGEAAIERRYAEAHLSEWLESPRRDPFLLAGAGLDKTSITNPSPVAGWRLKGIWRQTGNRVAAINDRVYAEGDKIQGDNNQGYKVERIEGDEVWFDGPRGKERLRFEKAEKGTNANSTGPNPSNSPPLGFQGARP